MNSVRTALILSLFLVTSVGAAAGTASGNILMLIARTSDGLTYFTLSGATTGAPACATGGYWMIPNENSDVGKRVYAAALAAKISGAQIQVVGTGTCTRWGDGEDVLELRIIN